MALIAAEDGSILTYFCPLRDRRRNGVRNSISLPSIGVRKERHLPSRIGRNSPRILHQIWPAPRQLMRHPPLNLTR